MVKKINIGCKINIQGINYTVVEGPCHDESGDSYILEDENNYYFDIEFQENRIIFSKAKKYLNEGWEFSDHKEIKHFKIISK